jgi:hypothetical protein
MVRFLRMLVVVCLFLAAAQTALAQQHRVDPRNMYERVMAIVPWTGSGTHADPKRAKYAPAPGQVNPTSRTGILAFQCLPSDDGLLALCEYVAKDRAALNPILTDPGVKAFVKGRDKPADIVSEFSKHVKNFDINRFGVRVP